MTAEHSDLCRRVVSVLSVNQKLRTAGSIAVLAIAAVAAFTGHSSDKSAHASFSPVADTSILSGEASYPDSKLPSDGDQKDSGLPFYPAMEQPSYPAVPQPSYPAVQQPSYPAMESPSVSN